MNATDHLKLIRVSLVALTSALALFASAAHGQQARPPAKIAGMPTEIVKEAFASPDPEQRRRIFALVAQRVVRNPNVRQRFLDADPTELGLRLARFEHSTEMLTQARAQTTNVALQEKLTQIIAAIAVAQTSSQ